MSTITAPQVADDSPIEKTISEDRPRSSSSVCAHPPVPTPLSASRRRGI
jgi:hypothetical protein